MRVEVSKNEVIVQVDQKPVEVVVGPAVSTGGGGGGTPAPTVPHDVLIDFVSQTSPVETIIGTAVAGSPTSSPVWAIKKVIVPTGATMSILWADGNKNEDNVWDNRASLTYM